MIKVKALEWQPVGPNSYQAAVGIKDCYSVYLDFVVNQWRWRKSGMMGDTKSYKMEDAKAACQAHHEQHVLSMITEVADGAE